MRGRALPAQHTLVIPAGRQLKVGPAEIRLEDASDHRRRQAARDPPPAITDPGPPPPAARERSLHRPGAMSRWPFHLGLGDQLFRESRAAGIGDLSDLRCLAPRGQDADALINPPAAGAPTPAAGEPAFRGVRSPLICGSKRWTVPGRPMESGSAGTARRLVATIDRSRSASAAKSRALESIGASSGSVRRAVRWIRRDQPGLTSSARLRLGIFGRLAGMACRSAAPQEASRGA